jgi:RAB protein geranylgeranyltransferase component A
MMTLAEKQELIDWVKNLEDQTLLQHLKELKDSEESEKGAYLISEPEREGIMRGMEDLANGRVKTHEEVQAELREKFPHFFK